MICIRLKYLKPYNCVQIISIHLRKLEFLVWVYVILINKSSESTMKMIWLQWQNPCFFRWLIMCQYLTDWFTNYLSVSLTKKHREHDLSQRSIAICTNFFLTWISMNFNAVTLTQSMIKKRTLNTCQRRWMIGRRGERGSGISVLAARHDDDDEISF